MCFFCFCFGCCSQADAPAIPAAELSGEKVTLISKTNSKFEIPREVAEMSELVKNSLVSKGGEEEDTDEDSDEGSSEDGDGGGGSASQEVPVRVVDDACLAKAIKFMEYHRTNPLAPAEKPIVSNNIEDIFQDPFDRVRSFVQQRSLRLAHANCFFSFSFPFSFFFPILYSLRSFSASPR